MTRIFTRATSTIEGVVLDHDVAVLRCDNPLCGEIQPEATARMIMLKPTEKLWFSGLEYAARSWCSLGCLYVWGASQHDRFKHLGFLKGINALDPDGIGDLGPDGRRVVTIEVPA